MTAPETTRTFYRIVTATPPVLQDFFSDRERGKPRRGTGPDIDFMWNGFSVFETEDQARAQAARFPKIGDYIARLEIPDEASLQVRRTGSTDGHHTIQGAAEVVCQYVVHVAPVRPADQSGGE